MPDIAVLYAAVSTCQSTFRHSGMRPTIYEYDDGGACVVLY